MPCQRGCTVQGDVCLTSLCMRALACSSHGVALNVTTDLSAFNAIIVSACGLYTRVLIQGCLFSINFYFLRLPDYAAFSQQAGARKVCH